jgi:hypothetical protein
MPPKQKQAEQQPKSDAALIAIIAGALAIGASAQITATTLSPLIGIPVPPLLLVLQVSGQTPPSYGIPTLPSSSATSEAQALEPTYRAQYILAASRRARAALQAGVPAEKVRADEQRYFRLHLDAMTNRKKSAAQVDSATKRFGTTLGWHAVMDNRTSAECRAAHGRNFDATRRPAIGYPGSVHPHCRCRAGKPFSTSKTVYSVKPEERAA